MSVETLAPAAAWSGRRPAWRHWDVAQPVGRHHWTALRTHLNEAAGGLRHIMDARLGDMHGPFTWGDTRQRTKFRPLGHMPLETSLSYEVNLRLEHSVHNPTFEKEPFVTVDGRITLGNGQAFLAADPATGDPVLVAALFYRTYWNYWSLSQAGQRRVNRWRRFLLRAWEHAADQLHIPIYAAGIDYLLQVDEILLKIRERPRIEEAVRQMHPRPGREYVIERVRFLTPSAVLVEGPFWARRRTQLQSA